MFVVEFGLFSTTFKRVDGQTVIAPNALLANTKTVHNLRRSNSMYVTLFLVHTQADQAARSPKVLAGSPSRIPSLSSSLNVDSLLTSSQRPQVGDNKPHGGV